MKTGETKARQYHQQVQYNGRGRRQTESISQGRQGQKGRQQKVRVVRTVQVTTVKYTKGKRWKMSDGAKQDFAVSAWKCAAICVCVCVCVNEVQVWWDNQG